MAAYQFILFGGFNMRYLHMMRLELMAYTYVQY